MTAKPHILVVDDEPQIQLFLRHALAAAGYEVEPAADGATALRLAAARMPELIVLDLGLPDLDGKAVIGELRQRSSVPIIVLSAREHEAEKIAALDLGANDFVATPFAIGELLARIRAALRAHRPEEPRAERLTLGDVTVDIAAHRVERAGTPVKLTPKEFDLLVLLARNPGRVLTHRHILTRIWGPAHADDMPYLRVFIGQLRQKIEADPAEPRLIVTEPGVGYRASDKP